MVFLNFFVTTRVTIVKYGIYYTVFNSTEPFGNQGKFVCKFAKYRPDLHID